MKKGPIVQLGEYLVRNQRVGGSNPPRSTNNKKNMNKKINQHSFTLIEIIITILILAALAAIATPRFNHMIENQRAATAAMTIKNVFQSQRRYFVDNENVFASNLGDLDIDLTAPEGFNFTALNINNQKVAGIQRIDSPFKYTLWIKSTGELYCLGASCSKLSPDIIGHH